MSVIARSAFELKGKPRMGTVARSEFEELVAARTATWSRTAILLTGDRDAAQDLLQSTLERLLQRWRSSAAIDNPDAYVRRVMVNLLTDRWRRKSRFVEVPLDTAVPRPESGIGPYSQIDLRRSLITAMHRLPAGIRAVLVLRYFEDLTDAEIAETLGISTGTVRSQTARGLAKLRAVVGYGEGPNGDVVALSPGGDA